MTEVQLYANYLRNLRHNSPQDVLLMRAVFRAYDAIQSGKAVTQQVLEPIVTAASDSRKLIFDIPTGYLNQLTCKQPKAREAVTNMAQDSRAFTRFNAIMCIGKSAPLEFRLRLLRQSLRDKSSRVRQKAADWAGRQRIKELLPELEKALVAEKHGEAKATIEVTLRLLRDGYIMKFESDGSVRITAFTRRGLGSRWFNSAEIERRGISAIVAEFAAID